MVTQQYSSSGFPVRDLLILEKDVKTPLGQKAQSALGLHYEGHTLDWLFLLLFLSDIIMWLIKSKPAFKILGRLLIGAVLTFIFPPWFVRHEPRPVYISINQNHRCIGNMNCVHL
jgi:hypothetical protein